MLVQANIGKEDPGPWGSLTEALIDVQHSVAGSGGLQGEPQNGSGVDSGAI
jgi:hypothetical protein